ncbi:hypothetical protein [Fibrobacter sp. UWP2]|uniref:hypothetical protein n=1 Tax=Fibrobacter sp. UWP2 TaxID=1896216 RepID=UPI00091E009D|nr:hypothetical protein [Fibrobacter sp. UWP2]SHI88285.1 hypothetical protein SAMN05720471_11017 [Fibrobacter sp. UWP2]
MNKKTYAALMFATSLAFVACGDDSSSTNAPVDQNEESTVTSSETTDGVSSESKSDETSSSSETKGGEGSSSSTIESSSSSVASPSSADVSSSSVVASSSSAVMSSSSVVASSSSADVSSSSVVASSSSADVSSSSEANLHIDLSKIPEECTDKKNGNVYIVIDQDITEIVQCKDRQWEYAENCAFTGENVNSLFIISGNPGDDKPTAKCNSKGKWVITHQGDLNLDQVIEECNAKNDEALFVLDGNMVIQCKSNQWTLSESCSEGEEVHRETWTFSIPSGGSERYAVCESGEWVMKTGACIGCAPMP